MLSILDIACYDMEYRMELASSTNYDYRLSHPEHGPLNEIRFYKLL